MFTQLRAVLSAAVVSCNVTVRAPAAAIVIYADYIRQIINDCMRMRQDRHVQFVALEGELAKGNEMQKKYLRYLYCVSFRIDQSEAICVPDE